MTHYLKPMNFTEDTINQATKFVNKFLNSKKMADEKFEDLEIKVNGEYIDDFVNCMSDDLNTSNAMASMLKANKEFNKEMRGGDAKVARQIWRQIMTMMDLFGWIV